MRDEALAVLLEHALDALDLEHVDADAEDHRARAHQLFHVAHRLRQAVEHGARDDGVADVELDDLGDGGDGLDVVVVEAVTRVHDEPERGGELRRRRARARAQRARARPLALA